MMPPAVPRPLCFSEGGGKRVRWALGDMVQGVLQQVVTVFPRREEPLFWWRQSATRAVLLHP